MFRWQIDAVSRDLHRGCGDFQYGAASASFVDPSGLQGDTGTLTYNGENFTYNKKDFHEKALDGGKLKFIVPVLPPGYSNISGNQNQTIRPGAFFSYAGNCQNLAYLQGMQLEYYERRAKAKSADLTRIGIEAGRPGEKLALPAENLYSIDTGFNPLTIFYEMPSPKDIQNKVFSTSDRPNLPLAVASMMIYRSWSNRNKDNDPVIALKVVANFDMYLFDLAKPGKNKLLYRVSWRETCTATWPAFKKGDGILVFEKIENALRIVPTFVSEGTDVKDGLAASLAQWYFLNPLKPLATLVSPSPFLR